MHFTNGSIKVLTEWEKREETENPEFEAAQPQFSTLKPACATGLLFISVWKNLLSVFFLLLLLLLFKDTVITRQKSSTEMRRQTNYTLEVFLHVRQIKICTACAFNPLEDQMEASGAANVNNRYSRSRWRMEMQTWRAGEKLDGRWRR